MADLLQNEALNDEVPLCLEAYELLWRAKAALRVPDSIVWKDGCVDAWYFSTVDRKGCANLKRKKSATIKLSGLRDKILAALSPSGSEPRAIAAKWVGVEPEQQQQSRVLYITHADLPRFVDLGIELGCGVLQRWLPPQNGRSLGIRVDWSPHTLLLEGRANLASVSGSWPNEHHLPLRQRLATFERLTESGSLLAQSGALYKINETVRRKLEATVAMLVDRLSSLVLPPHKLWRLQCTFVQDVQGRLIFSWCSSVMLVKLNPKGNMVVGGSCVSYDGNTSTAFGRGSDAPANHSTNAPARAEEGDENLEKNGRGKGKEEDVTRHHDIRHQRVRISHVETDSDDDSQLESQVAALLARDLLSAG